MSPIDPLPPTERQVRQWLREASEGTRRLLFTKHAEQRMQQRRIGRRQVLQVLRTGTISEPLHQDVTGDWRCSVSGFHAGMHLTVGVVLKQKEDGAWVIVATAFAGE
jgi:hypothetical protein